jgi:hypothetical protein
VGKHLHGKRLAGARLPIRQQAAVVALQAALRDGLAHAVKQRLLRVRVVHHVVKRVRYDAALARLYQHGVAVARLVQRPVEAVRLLARVGRSHPHQYLNVVRVLHVCHRCLASPRPPPGR